VRIATCPECGKEFEDPNDKPAGKQGSAEHRLARHMASHSDVPESEQQFSQDEPPQPRKQQAAKKQAAPKQPAAPKGGAIPLAVQLQLPYHLLGDVTANRLPQTSMALHANAAAAAAAWDRFLMRYPSIREKIEQGMIGADVLALVMVHVEILRVAREEITAQQAAMEHYEGGLQTSAA
jgi:hypothetical protein